MEKDQIRLECLKLAVGKTPDHGEALRRAEDFVTFVSGVLIPGTPSPGAGMTAGKDGGQIPAEGKNRPR